MWTNYLLFIALGCALTLSIVSLVIAINLNRRLKLLVNSLSSKSLKKYVKNLEARKSSLKRKRYLVFEVLSNSNISKEELNTAIKESFSKLFGNIDLAKSSINVLYFDVKSGKGIVRFRAPYKGKVLASLGLIKEVNSKSALIVPIRTCGTLRKAMKYIKQR